MLDAVHGRLPPAAPLLITVAVVLLLGVLATAGDSAVQVGTGWIPGFGPVEAAPAAETDPALRTDDFETPPALRAAAVIGLLAVSLYVVVLLMIGFAMLVAGLRLSRQRRRRRESAVVAQAPDDQPADAGPLRTAAARALQRLRARPGMPPTDAVVAAWLDLEQATADAGHARRPHETPTEYSAAVVAQLGLGDDTRGALQDLRQLYHRARYSDQPLQDADVDTAEALLARIVNSVQPGVAAR
jgi:hypothetical protein